MLQFVFNGKKSSILLEKCRYTIYLFSEVLRQWHPKVFKSLHKLSPTLHALMNDVFQVKYVSYDLQDNNILCQHMRDKILYGNHF